MNTLLCLLSDQRMQNVIPLLQNGFHFDRVVLLASQEQGRISSRFSRIATDLSTALKSLTKWELHPFPVDPMLPEATRHACIEAIRRAGGPEQVTINFTGGTKPMSIGAYQAGLECNTKLLYVDTQAERIYTYNGNRPDSIPFDLKPLGVEMLLAIHGKLIDQKATDRKALSKIEMSLTELIYAHRPQSLLVIPQIREQVETVPNSDKKVRSTPLEPWLQFPGFFHACIELGYVQQSGSKVYITPAAFRFLDGRWLEGYVYLALKKSCYFVDVKSQVKLSGVENELDISCTINAKLGVVECKSRILKGPKGQSTVNLLRALRDSLGGTFAKSFFITPYPPESYSRQFIKRANEYVSCLIHQEELTRVEDVIKHEMCKKRQ